MDFDDEMDSDDVMDFDHPGVTIFTNEKSVDDFENDLVMFHQRLKRTVCHSLPEGKITKSSTIWMVVNVQIWQNPDKVDVIAHSSHFAMPDKEEAYWKFHTLMNSRDFPAKKERVQTKSKNPLIYDWWIADFVDSSDETTNDSGIEWTDEDLEFSPKEIKISCYSHYDARFDSNLNRRSTDRPSPDRPFPGRRSRLGKIEMDGKLRRLMEVIFWVSLALGLVFFYQSWSAFDFAEIAKSWSGKEWEEGKEKGRFLRWLGIIVSLVGPLSHYIVMGKWAPFLKDKE